MRFVISLGWGRDDFSNGALNPVEFAASVGRIVEENGLDGFDVDYENDSIEEESFDAVDAFYDLVQMQAYDAGTDLGFPPSVVVGRVASEKVLFGRDIENGDTLVSARYAIPDVVAYVRDNELRGLMGWRINSASQMSEPELFPGVELSATRSMRSVGRADSAVLASHTSCLDRRFDGARGEPPVLSELDASPSFRDAHAAGRRARRPRDGDGPEP